MSALAHMLEARGIATVAIGLVRHQMEQTQPPRGLWVPFELGRPLGEPEDPAFQHRVLRHALGLLERQDGPVILEDFPDDAPGWADQPGWQPPLPPARPSADADLPRRFADELAALRPAWAQAQARFNRTTVGLSGQPPEAWPALLAEALAGGLPVRPPHPTTALLLRFLSDDVKALYSESAQAAGPAPASRQIDRWFWRQTTAGALLAALRAATMASPNNALRTVGTRFFVPTPFLPG